MMTIGVRAHDFGRQEPDSLGACIKAAGFNCTQLAPAKAITGISHFNDITDYHIDSCQRAFAAHDVEIAVLGCYIEPALADRIQRLEQVEIFKKNLTYATKLGTDIVGTETTHLDINCTTTQRENAYQLLKDSLLRMAEKAEKEQIYIGIEPVAEHTLNTVEITQRLLEEVNCKWVKIIFDPVNLVLPSTINNQAQIFANMLTYLGSHIVAMHIKDIAIENGKKVWRNIGAGLIDYGPIITWLKANKPHMPLLREGVAMDSYKKDLQAMENLVVG